MKLTLLALLCCAFSASNSMASATAAVVAAENARRDALLKGDAAALKELLAEDLAYTHSNGRLESKGEFIAGIASKDVRYERFNETDLVARQVSDNVCTLNGMIDQKKFSSGKWGEVRLLFLAVWRKENGKWRMTSMQTALLPAK